jgi:hypothetical protein
MFVFLARMPFKKRLSCFCLLLLLFLVVLSALRLPFFLGHRRLLLHGGAGIPLLRRQILDRRLDGILRQHRAMQLHRGQLQMRGNIRVLDRQALIHRLALQPLSRHRAGGNRRAAPKGLELALDDLPVRVHADLELHHVTAGGGTDQALRQCVGGRGGGEEW